MRTKIFLGFLFLCISSFAQMKEIFRDDFKDNSKLWPVIDIEIASSSFENGNYIISCKRDKEKYLYLRSLYFDPYEDFSIESRLKLENGQPDQSFGIVFGASDEKNYYSFEISLSGKAVVLESNNQEYKELAVADNILINPRNEYNLLQVSKSGSRAVFFVNNKKIFEIKLKKSFGLFIGFVLNQKSKVAVDYISMRQDGLNINVVDNSMNGYKKNNLGARINTQFEELAPIISPDGKTLYITCRNNPNNTDIKDDDVWYSSLYPDSTWSPTTNLGTPINNKDNNSVISVLTDGNTLIVGGNYTDKGTENNGLSITHRTATGWSLPEKVLIDNFYNYNDFSGHSMSADGNYLISAVEREDSKGELDLYISFKKNDGSYTEPKNLGSEVNTSTYDAAPFLAADNVTLYYATRGLPGFGSTDIFVAKRLDDSWTKWSAPKNLGPEVNSTSWDGYYTISASGDFAYFVSYKNTYGKSDIFRMPIPPSARPNPVVLVAGRIVDPSTNKPVCNAQIEYFDLKKNKIAGKTTSSPIDGTYKIVLPYGKIYSFVAIKDSFYCESSLLDLTDLKNYQEVMKNLVLAPIKSGQIIRMNNLFFDVNKAELDPSSFAELNRLIELLIQYPKMEIEIAGHTDSDGDDAHNNKLSQLRADAVKNYLTSKKINSSRLISKGYGETKPCADNKTDFGKSLNRRVEFIILKLK